MSDELPIYSDSVFKSANPFPALETIRAGDVERCIERFDKMLDHGEDAGGIGDALAGIGGMTKQDILDLHRKLFEGRPGAGELRTSRLAASFRGQDCPEPEFLNQSLDNFEMWFSDEALAELHPIQQAALALTRLVDIWPFEFGNRTTAIVFANSFLLRAGYPPFFVLQDQLEEFEEVMSQAILMQTEPLVRAMYKCMERELNVARP